MPTESDFLPAFTTDNLAALNAAIASGAKEVMYGDKRIVYQSLEQLLRLRGIMMRELAVAQETTRTYPGHSKGLLPGCGPDTSRYYE